MARRIDSPPPRGGLPVGPSANGLTGGAVDRSQALTRYLQPSAQAYPFQNGLVRLLNKRFPGK